MQDYQRGQILLIVVLVMVTVLTVGLSVAVRTITNTRTTQEDASSEQAFSAAEAGIEKSLSSKSPTSGNFANSSTFSTTVITIGGPGFALNNNAPVLKDQPIDLWLSTYPGYGSPRTGGVTIFWGSTSDACNANEARNTMAALEILIFHGTAGGPVMRRVDVDPCPPRRAGNKFQLAGGGGPVAGVGTFRFSTSFNVPTGYFVRIVPLYAPATIAANGCNAGVCSDLPVQGTLVQATGSIGSTQRKIQTYQYYPQLPAELLQYSFFVPQ